jgi:uncharacterized protein YaeQ
VIFISSKIVVGSLVKIKGKFGVVLSIDHASDLACLQINVNDDDKPVKWYKASKLKLVKNIELGVPDGKNKII